MRMWSINPEYLDAAGIVALWRETLLAQKVLHGQTKGYRNHPQLERFTAHPEPISAIGAYLSGVHAEATARGYNFDATKIAKPAPRDQLAGTSAANEKQPHDKPTQGTTPNRTPARCAAPLQRIQVTDGQLEYELAWLRSKLEKRSPATLEREIWQSPEIQTHPMFTTTPGPVAVWEKAAAWEKATAQKRVQ